MYTFEDKILPSLYWLKHIALYPDILRMVHTKKIFQDVAIKLSFDAYKCTYGQFRLQHKVFTQGLVFVFSNTKFKGFFLGFSGICTGKN